MIKFIEETNSIKAYINEQEIGVCEYIEKDNNWNIIHTKVNENYQGKGIAKKLVEKVITKANENNKKVTATCSYAKRILDNKNKEVR